MPKLSHSASDFAEHWASAALTQQDPDAHEIYEDNHAVPFPDPGETPAALLARSLDGLDLQGAHPSAFALEAFRHKARPQCVEEAAQAICDAWPALSSRTTLRAARRMFLAAWNSRGGR